jgi:dUTP pyrophosphatase
MAKAYDTIEINYKKLIKEAKLPVKPIEVDAGFDLYAISKEETEDYIEYRTGIAFEIPEGMVGLVFSRSSVTKYDVMLKNCVGVIDASYRGEVICRFYDTKQYNGEFKIVDLNGVLTIQNVRNEKKIYEVGDRIAQVVFLLLPKVKLNLVDKLSESERGTEGFGHTGK